MRRYGLAAVALVFLCGACADTATEPEVNAPTPAFDMGGQGNGTTFLLKSEVGGLIGWGFGDDDGDACSASLLGFDVNDFVKISPAGYFLDFARGEVQIAFVDASTGNVWFGSGQGHLNSSGFEYWNTTITGKVSYGAETRGVVCNALIDDAKGKDFRESRLVG